MRTSTNTTAPTDQIIEHGLPAAIDIERRILGAILLNASVFDEAIELLCRGDFFLDSHRRIFDRMCNLASRGVPIELATLHESLQSSGELGQVGGASYLAALIEVIRTDTIKHYAEIVKRKSRARQALSICNDLITRIYDGEDDADLIIEQTQAKIAEISKSHNEAHKVHGFYPSLDALFDADLYEPEEIMRAVRRGEVTGLMAVTNYGKSTVLFNASLSLAAGEVCFPLTSFASTPRRILYLDFENPAAMLRSDLQTMLRQIKHREIAQGNFIPVVDASVKGEPLRLSRADHFKVVIAWTKACKADLVVIDTAASAFELQDENSNAEVTRRLMNPLKKLASEANCAVVFTHHIGKANETQATEGAYRGRGASAFGALARTILTIERDAKKGDGYIVLSTQKAKGPAFEPTLMRLNRETRWFELCDEKPEAKPEPPSAHEIAEFVREKVEARTEEIKYHFTNRASDRTIANRIREAAKLKLIFKPNQQVPWRVCKGEDGYFEGFSEITEESIASDSMQACNPYKELHTAHSNNGNGHTECIPCSTCGRLGPRLTECSECGDLII